MATMLETPSRIWRRIEAIEDRDMPSLPSLPPFEDSVEEGLSSSEVIEDDYGDHQFDESLEDVPSPMQSTPAGSSHHTAASTIRAPLSNSSTSRFANSIASRSVKSTGFTSAHDRSARTSRKDSFDISDISSIPTHMTGKGTMENGDEEQSKSSVPELYLPPEDEDEGSGGEREYSLTDALQSVSRPNSPSSPLASKTGTPREHYDYSVSLKSEPKGSPFDKYRNVAMRRTVSRTRTPSLSRTTNSSQSSSPAASTPQSNKSIALAWSDAGSPISSTTLPLPPVGNESPAAERQPQGGEDLSYSEHDESQRTQEGDVRSMDITDLHISPQRIDDDQDGPVNHQESHEGLSPEQETVLPPAEDREPTFSSEGDSTPYSPQHRTVGLYSKPSPGGISNALSSPAPSLAFTPTPAFPRPRARFNLAKPPSELLSTPAHKEVDQQDDLVTPHTRRRSFLLSVINSTARPRMKFPTPHPRQIQNTPSVVESTPVPRSGGSSSPSSGVNLQSAFFAGVTPRPRMPPGKRISHPLAQTMSVSPETSESKAAGGGATLQPWATPAHSSPYDGVGDRASFISTASSHDLTTHHRVNTSFDPSMGFGAAAQGHGVGRFNAGKLNNYLHGLNRRLQEENESLLARLRRIEEEKDKKSEPDIGRQLSGANRRVSAGGTLGNVQEDMAEGWLEEKAELEEIVEAFKEEVTRCMEQKEAVEKELQNEREERERDQERWKERMGEVEEGVAGIVTDLEQKLEVAEERVNKAEERAEKRIKEMDKELTELKAEMDFATERATKAEQVLESGKDLGGELNEANERIGQVMGDLRNANVQIKELEDEVIRADARIDELEKDLQEDKHIISGLEEDLNATSDALTAERAKTSLQEETLRQLEEELQATKDYVNELEEGATIAMEQLDKYEKELGSAQQTIKAVTATEQQAVETIKDLEEDAQRAQDVARQMEEALEEAEKKMLADEDSLANLKAKVAFLERERTKLKQVADAAQEPSLKPLETGPTEADMEALEHELDEANKEIARLSTLLSQSPARKAMEKAKDAKIEMLEREKEELLERNKVLRMTFNEMTTPSKPINTSGISPIHRHVLSMSIRAPRTPGGPLRDMSWLNNTPNDPSVSPLIAEINRLQHELDIANDSIDDKLDKLGDAGLGVIGLTKKLEDARVKIARLEDEIGRLSRKEDRYMRRLARARCKKCKVKLDLHRLAQADESTLDISRDTLPSEPPTPPTRTTEVLRADLQAVNSHLDDLKKKWEHEKQQLLGEKVALQDAANRLNTQVKNVKDEVKKVVESGRAGEKAKANTQSELDRAKRTISELEGALSDERARLRSLATEQDRVQREKKRVLADLQRTESDMEGVKHQLQKFKQENQELERELRQNSTAEQKARLLENRVAENAETISHLRQERSLLATDHKDLQHRYSELSETVNELRKEHAAHSTSHDNWRHQLDLQLLEIEDLKQALETRESDLQKAQKEKEKVISEKGDVTRTIAALEADLKRVRRDAEAFGRDLKSLRVDKERLESRLKEEIAKGERTKKQSQTQVRLLNEQLDTQKEKTSRAREDFRNHECAADEKQISAMKLQHNKECKGLIVQIRYLKAKFTRESSFRFDLVYQKKYLLVLLSQFEKSERTIFASIARIGFPVAHIPPVTKKPRKLKSVAMMIVFLARIKQSSGAWREQGEAKAAVNAALEEVRRKRALAS